KTPPFLPTSSPSTTMVSSRRISSARVERTDSMKVITAMALALARVGVAQHAPRTAVADKARAGPERVVHARGWRVEIDVLLGGGGIRLGLSLGPVGGILDDLACLGH